MVVVVDSYEDRETRNGHSDGYQGEQKAMLETIREESNNHRETKCGCPRWNGVQLCSIMYISVYRQSIVRKTYPICV